MECRFRASGHACSHCRSPVQNLAKILREPAIVEQLAGFGAETIGSTPAELERFRRAEIVKWQKVVKDSGLKLD